MSTSTLPPRILRNISRPMSLGAFGAWHEDRADEQIHRGREAPSDALRWSKGCGAVCSVMSRKRIRSRSTSRMVTSAPRPCAIRAAFDAGSTAAKHYYFAGQHSRHATSKTPLPPKCLARNSRRPGGHAPGDLAHRLGARAARRLTSNRFVGQSLPLTEALIKSGVTALAYETIEVNRRLPLLEPMSEIAGACPSWSAAIFLPNILAAAAFAPVACAEVLPAK